MGYRMFEYDEAQVADGIMEISITDSTIKAYIALRTLNNCP